MKTLRERMNDIDLATMRRVTTQLEDRLSERTIRSVMNGTGNPSVVTLEQVAKAFGVQVHELMDPDVRFYTDTITGAVMTYRASEFKVVKVLVNKEEAA